MTLSKLRFGEANVMLTFQKQKTFDCNEQTESTFLILFLFQFVGFV